MEPINRQHPLFVLAMILLTLQLLAICGTSVHYLSERDYEPIGIILLCWGLLHGIMMSSFYRLRNAGLKFFIVTGIVRLIEVIVAFCIVGFASRAAWFCLILSLLLLRLFWIIYTRTEQTEPEVYIPDDIDYKYYNHDGGNKAQE